MLLLFRAKEMKDVNFVLKKQQEKGIWILVIFDGKKEKRQSPSSPLALLQCQAAMEHS